MFGNPDGFFLRQRNSQVLVDINGRPGIQIVGRNQVRQFNTVYSGNFSGSIASLDRIYPAFFLLVLVKFIFQFGEQDFPIIIISVWQP